MTIGYVVVKNDLVNYYTKEGVVLRQRVAKELSARSSTSASASTNSPSTLYAKRQGALATRENYFVYIAESNSKEEKYYVLVKY